jgi:hypothetical protein
MSISISPSGQPMVNLQAQSFPIILGKNTATGTSIDSDDVVIFKVRLAINIFHSIAKWWDLATSKAVAETQRCLFSTNRARRSWL